MFDPKSLIDMLTRGAAQAQQPQQAQGTGGLGDILGQLGQALGQPAGAQPSRGGQGSDLGGLGDLLRNMVPTQQGQPPRSQIQQDAGQGGGLGGLEDILKNMLPGGAGGQTQGQPPAQRQAPGGEQGGGLGDILGKLQEQLGRGGQGGGLMDILGQVLGQATQGVKEGAQRIDQSTGASGHARYAVGRATGHSPEELFNQLKDLIAENKVAAGAAAGGLGTVLLGTRTGRAITGKAVKIGGLALIAGLAYKALQNYQAGKPLITGGPEANIVEAPHGSGFETSAITNQAATTYLRGMIAAAAADGRIDEGEHKKLIGGLKQAGIDAEAEEFLAAELNNPATVDALVAGVSTPEEAVQLFTAARIAVDVDTQEEHDFLVALAQGLQIDAALVQHIDATARAAS